MRNYKDYLKKKKCYVQVVRISTTACADPTRMDPYDPRDTVRYARTGRADPYRLVRRKTNDFISVCFEKL